MWTHLPLGQLHQTTNYGCAGGVCEGRYANIYHLQAQRKIDQIEAKILEMKQDDPTMYFVGDFDDLLDQHQAMTQRLKEPFS